MVKHLKIVGIILFVVTVFVMCMDEPQENRKPLPVPTSEIAAKTIPFDSFAGSASCKACHAEIYNDHLQTNHFKSSKPASEKSIAGSFKKGYNEFAYNPELSVTMEKRDTGLYQVVHYQDKEVLSLLFGITIGSGNKGQSYAYWQNSHLFQMPMTYYSVAGRWANSPGFPNKVQYERPITSRCIECHATHAELVPSDNQAVESFDRDKIIYGIDCEKCHGAAAGHVAFHKQNPGSKSAQFIVNPAGMSRQQKLDLCALCHGGRLERKQPAFTFQSGDVLADYFHTENINKVGRNYVSVDVHGNQYGLLSASKCFIKSDMTCNTCHDPHRNERKKLEIFSARCASCHQDIHQSDKIAKAVNTGVIKSNCIDCHMPVEQSHAIVLFTSGMDKPNAAEFRSHFISVYDNATQRFIDEYKGKRN